MHARTHARTHPLTHPSATRHVGGRAAGHLLVNEEVLYELWEGRARVLRLVVDLVRLSLGLLSHVPTTHANLSPETQNYPFLA